jgi:hypothetical protein
MPIGDLIMLALMLGGGVLMLGAFGRTKLYSDQMLSQYTNLLASARRDRAEREAAASRLKK